MLYGRIREIARRYFMRAGGGIPTFGGTTTPINVEIITTLKSYRKINKTTLNLLLTSGKKQKQKNVCRRGTIGVYPATVDMYADGQCPRRLSLENGVTARTPFRRPLRRRVFFRRRWPSGYETYAEGDTYARTPSFLYIRNPYDPADRLEGGWTDLHD